MTARLFALFPRNRDASPTMIAAAGGVLTLLLLLGNRPGLAIVVASLVIPAAALFELNRRDAFEDEPRWAIPAMLGWGALIGIVIGAIGAVIAAAWWIDGAPLHVGAAGFGGAAADREGPPGFAVLVLNGIALSAAGLTLAALGPYALRRYPVFRNEVMDGITLGVAAGSGLATGTTIVYVWPIISGSGPSGGSVADWTALLIGVLITRPIILGLTVGLVCGGVWHVALSQRSVDLSLPVGIGVGGAVLFALGDLLVQPSGTRVELLWHVLVAIGLVLAARVLFGRGLATDRVAGALRVSRVVCPNCGSLTPAGQFCAVCGQPLRPGGAPTAPPDDATAPIELVEAEAVDAEWDDRPR